MAYTIILFIKVVQRHFSLFKFFIAEKIDLFGFKHIYIVSYIPTVELSDPYDALMQWTPSFNSPESRIY